MVVFHFVLDPTVPTNEESPAHKAPSATSVLSRHFLGGDNHIRPHILPVVHLFLVKRRVGGAYDPVSTPAMLKGRVRLKAA
jgi:hypothetical protein